LKIRFPNIIFKLKENGLDLTKDLIKVSPAEHYLNGGIRTGYDGRTNIEGLYSCGETAATGAHGANRLASNSLMEGLVCPPFTPNQPINGFCTIGELLFYPFYFQIQ